MSQPTPYPRRYAVNNFTLYPRVVKAGEKTHVTILGAGSQCRFAEGESYTVKFNPMENWGVDSRIEEERGLVIKDRVTVVCRDGKLEFDYTFTHEQKWRLRICKTGDGKDFTYLHLYSVEADFYGLIPYKGDLHVHSLCSDGVDDPALLASHYRRFGYDFITLTDHKQHLPSRELIRYYEKLPINMKIFPGEEVHLTNTYMHIVNFAGDQSVNELYYEDKEAYRKMAADYAETLQVPPEINRLEYAYRKMVAEQIREGGGLPILAHPFWEANAEYNMNLPMTQYLIRTGAYGAYEVIGGIKSCLNNLQTSLYNEMRAEGLEIPVVGSSDMHGFSPMYGNTFDQMKTVVLAEDMGRESVINGILSLKSAAVEQRSGEIPRVYGNFRMVKYVRFLLEEYFPLHDELCVEEGRLMKAYCFGDESAEAQLAALSGRTEKFAKKFLFGQE